MEYLRTWAEHGLWNLPWWGNVIFLLIVTHITILSVTIFLHRCQAHRALDLHPSVSHFFRFWLWLTTGMITKEWAAVHRKHHAFSDIKGDPHSPNVFGIKKVLLEGAELYQDECNNKDTLNKYGNGTPDDFLERNLYSKHSKLGISIMLIIDLLLFGPIGLSIWGVQMLWIPITAAGVINGIGHFFGYRNFSTSDNSRNIFPIGLLIGGEELHNNHHTYGTSAKLSVKWYEIDCGWFWIKLLSWCKLAHVKRTLPVIKNMKNARLVPDSSMLDSVILNRYNLMVRYLRCIKLDCKQEFLKLKDVHSQVSWRQCKHLLIKDYDFLNMHERYLVKMFKERSHVMCKIFNAREELSALWKKSNLTREELLQKLHDWCKQAEASGIHRLRMFSMQLRTIQ